MRLIASIARRFAARITLTFAFLAAACSGVEQREFEPTPLPTVGSPLDWRYQSMALRFDEDADLDFDELGVDEPEEAAIRRMFDTGVTIAARTNMLGSTPVVVEVDVLQFDALSKFERVVTGGVHYILIDIAVTDPSTGERLAGFDGMEMERLAYGGFGALAAVGMGETQERRIIELIQNDISNWLASL